LTDDELFQVAKLARTETFPKDQVIVHEDEAGDCIYLLDKGKVRVVRNTPFGEYCLSTYKKGRLFGEMNFIDDRHYSADVVALQETACYKFNNRELRELFETRKNIAVAFLWYFWSTLSQNIREMNEQMKEFFLQEALSQDRQIDEKRLAKAEKVIVDINKKLEAFRDKGLTPEETRVLASMSSEELFTKDGLIFTEGSPGNKLYIVLDGRVRITKQIPGVGEEALAILSRGDFFGEMALVDSAPRSADAKAHEGNATVLAIDKAVLDDVLHSNIDSAVQFLTIICKILSYRLREINDTLVKWKIMSGGF
jgi:CRP/FNR family cyclic AMP-dependent transcriptional regulator